MHVKSLLKFGSNRNKLKKKMQIRLYEYFKSKFANFGRNGIRNGNTKNLSFT